MKNLNRAGLWLCLLIVTALILTACGGQEPTLSLTTPTGAASIVSVATTGAAGNTTAAATAASQSQTVQPTSADATATPAAPSTTSAPTSAANSTAASDTTAAPITAGGLGDSSTPGSSTKVPRYEAASSCPFKLGQGQTEGPNLRCGYLIVPEDHANPNNGRTLKLAVAFLRNTSAGAAQNRPVPVVFLQGGPGGASDDIIQLFGSNQFPIRSILQDRDLIIFDQRGVGHSEPNLFCSELDDLAHQDLDKITPPDVSNQKFIDASLKCRDRLKGQGINLADYTSAQNASDVDDLRQALNLPKVDLYGVSYGTRLALTVMRDHPQAVRSVILDSTYSPQASLDVDAPTNADRAFNELFKACAADAACNRDYPNLKDTFSKVYAQLKQTPAMVKVKDSHNNQTYTVAVDGNLLVQTMFNLLYSSEVLPILPAFLTTIQQGHYELLAYLLPDVIFTEPDISRGMYYSVQCSEEIPFEKASDLADHSKNVLPEIRSAFVDGGTGEFTVCQQWPSAKPNPIENQPVTSNIPTLILAGQFDPITPPSSGQDAAKTLSNSFFVQFPATGHGASLVSSPTGDCAARITRNFLLNPTAKPNTACTSQISLNFLPASQINALLQRIQQLGG